MSYQMGKLVEMDELVECHRKGSQIAIFEFASLSLSILIILCFHPLTNLG